MKMLKILLEIRLRRESPPREDASGGIPKILKELDNPPEAEWNSTP